MQLGRLIILSLALLALPGFVMRGGGIPSSSAPLALTRTFNQPTGTTTPANAFWMIGQPEPVNAWPAGSIVTATLAGSPVRVNSCNEDNGMLVHSNGSIRWARLLVDYSGQTISPGGNASLVLTPTSGSWSTTTSRSNADWEGLHDTVTIAPPNSGTNILYSGTTGVAGYDTPAGTWTATFDGGASNKIVTICKNPLGLYVKVYANFVNGSTTHCQLRARMDYWVTEKSNGTLGPIESWGPFFDNTQLFVNSSPCTDGSGGFTGDLTWLRNGVAQRQQLDVPVDAGGIIPLVRPDAQGDWSANDPQVWVSQDYTMVRQSEAIPPYASGISYTGGWGGPTSVAISAVNTTTGVFTVSSIQGLTNKQYHPANLIEFNGSLGGVTGISLNTPYWMCSLSATTFELYQTVTQANAGYAGAAGTFSCPSVTGLITLGGSYSGGMTAQPDMGPAEGGLWAPAMGSPGSIPDLSWASEWGGAYVVGNTQAFQRQARIQAYVLANIPIWVVDTNQCVVSVMDSVGTPSTGTNCMGGTGLGPARTTAQWTDRGSFGGGINVPSDGNGVVWIWGIEGSHWPGAVEYITWLLEGPEFLQDMVIMDGGRGMASRLAGFGRNAQIHNTGTIYYGQSLNAFAPGVVRYGAWSFRGVSVAAYAAPEGSAEQTLFRNNIQSNINAISAYDSYMGTNFTNLGIFENDNQWGQCATVGCNGSPFISNFMQWFADTVAGMTDALDGEFVTGMSTIYNPQMVVQLGTVACPFFADAFNLNASTSDLGAALPGNWVSSVLDIGISTGTGFFTYSTTGNIVSASVAGFQSASNGLLPFQLGDKARPQNWQEDSSVANPAPSPFVDGTDYSLINISGANYNLSSGSGPITVGANATGVGGTLIPTGQPCPSSNMYGEPVTSADGYPMQRMAALGVAAAMSVPSASSAWTIQAGRMSPNPPAICSTETNWCFGPSW